MIATSPTPTADSLERRFSDFATLGEALDYAANGVRVDDKVLAELLGWLDAEHLGKIPNLCRSEQAHSASSGYIEGVATGSSSHRP